MRADQAVEVKNECGPDPDAEREIRDPGIAQVGDGVHYVSDPHDQCWHAVVTRLTASPLLVSLTAFPPDEAPTPLRPTMFDELLPRAGTWHLQDACPYERRHLCFPRDVSVNVLELLPVGTAVQAVRWNGSNAAEVKRFCGARPGPLRRDIDEAFLEPGEITGQWRTPHVWHAGRKSWDPVTPGDWIIRDLTGLLEVLTTEQIAMKYYTAVSMVA